MMKQRVYCWVLGDNEGFIPAIALMEQTSALDGHLLAAVAARRELGTLIAVGEVATVEEHRSLKNATN